MPHLNKIVKAINDHLKTGALKGESFQGGKFYGLAKRVTRTGENLQAVPALMASDGIGEDVTPDETYPFSIYHRCLAGTSEASNDTFTNYKVPLSMLAVVYADPQKIGMTQEDLAIIIMAGMPTDKGKIENTELKLRSWYDVKPLVFNNDSYQVYTGEYQGGEYRFQPQSIYFSLSYKIEITADRDCVICS